MVQNNFKLKATITYRASNQKHIEKNDTISKKSPVVIQIFAKTPFAVLIAYM